MDSDEVVTEDPGDVPDSKDTAPPVLDPDLTTVILIGKPDNQTIRAWRQAMRMTPGGLAHVLGYSRRHIIRLEQGDYAVTESFLKRMRQFVVDMAHELPSVPPGIPTRYSAPLQTADVWVPLNRIADSNKRGEKGDWKTCPGCGKEFYYTDVRKIYHSRSCKERAARRGESVGVRSNKRPGSAPRQFRCPTCGDIHPLAGNLVSPPARPAAAVRGAKGVSGDGQAEADTER